MAVILNQRCQFLTFLLVVSLSIVSFIYDYYVFTAQQIYDMMYHVSSDTNLFNSINNTTNVTYTNMNISNLIQTLDQNVSLFISISRQTIHGNTKYTVQFCSPQFGFGNFLAHYWFARSVSLFLNIDFQIGKHCKRFHRFHWAEFIHNMKQYVNNSKYQYIFDDLHISYSDRINWINMNIEICNQNHQDLDYVFTNNMRLLYHNRLFQQHFVIDEIKTAYDIWFKGNNYNITKAPTLNGPNNIVVYYRCGDLFSKAGHNKDYGMLTISYYEKAFHLIKSELMIDTAINSTITIWLMAQYTQKNTFEMRAPVHCRNIIFGYIEPALKDIAAIIFNMSVMNIKFIVSEAVTNPNIDYYMLVNAPILICSDSSFCSTAALANRNKMIIMPYHSYLFKYNEIRNSVSQYLLLPENVYNIEIDLENGMELNSDIAFTEEMTLFQIVKFLFNHSLYLNYSDYSKGREQMKSL